MKTHSTSGCKLNFQAQGICKSERPPGTNLPTMQPLAETPSAPLKPVSEMFGVSVAASRQSTVSLRFGQPASTRPPLLNAFISFPRLQEPPRKGPKTLRVKLFATWPLPNPSFNRTCYGGRRKAGLQHSVHCHKPALRHPPQPAG